MTYPPYEFVTIRISGGGASQSRTERFSTVEDAFSYLHMSGSKYIKVTDGGDRVVLEDLVRYRWLGLRSAVFHLDGVQHVPAAVVVSYYRATLVRAKRPLMAYEAAGFRQRPVACRKWHLRGVFGSVRIGSERRANNGMRHEEVAEDFGLLPRAKRNIRRGDYRYERPERRDRNWKRFRKTRWKNG